MLQKIEDYKRRANVRYGARFLRILGGKKGMEKCPRYTEAAYVINVWATIKEKEGIKDRTKLQECPNSENKN